MKNLFFVCLTFFLCNNLISAQPEEAPSLSKFSLHLEGSTRIVIHALFLNAEGLIASSKEGKIHLYGKAGFGSQRLISIICEPLIFTGGTLGLTMLTGNGNHHFELNGGAFLGSLKWKEDGPSILNCANDNELGFQAIPLLGLGYRFQKPGEGFIFRAKVGLNGVGIGIGYAF